MVSHPEVLGLIQAGGSGGRMDVLTRERAKPALPYGGVHLEEDHQPLPRGGERLGVLARDLVELGERLPLAVVLAQDDLGDVHAPTLAPGPQVQPPSWWLATIAARGGMTAATADMAIAVGTETRRTTVHAETMRTRQVPIIRRYHFMRTR